MRARIVSLDQSSRHLPERSGGVVVSAVCSRVGERSLDLARDDDDVIPRKFR